MAPRHISRAASYGGIEAQTQNMSKYHPRTSPEFRRRDRIRSFSRRREQNKKEKKRKENGTTAHQQGPHLTGKREAQLQNVSKYHSRTSREFRQRNRIRSFSRRREREQNKRKKKSEGKECAIVGCIAEKRIGIRASK
ncbi:hypothetical protein CEXT_350601 [Caerostris extrusa]|uniref:Uncharacterized protein n=1 Tax=Caerostris extrusa TaxID=172846 RepID=A0AAV4X4P0_CAEEX|nr:hypothetical protein CEXT_350601 [Caerostris extrusa]